jgi:hypothetical protein
MCSNQRLSVGRTDCSIVETFIPARGPVQITVPPGEAQTGCAALWANAAPQSDYDNDGIGDLCDPDPNASGLKVNPNRIVGGRHTGPVYTILDCSGETERIEFNTYGHDANGASVPRTGISVGACRCPRASWTTFCDSVCPRGREEAVPDSGDKAWDPITANQCNDYSHYESSDLDWDTENQLCRDREMQFAQRATTENTHAFDWQWKVFVNQESPVVNGKKTKIELECDTNSTQVSKIRVDWPNGTDDPVDNEKRFEPDQDARCRSKHCTLGIFVADWNQSPLWIIPWGPYAYDPLFDPLFDPLRREPLVALSLLHDPVSGLRQVTSLRGNPGKLVGAAEVRYTAGSAAGMTTRSPKAASAVLAGGFFGRTEARVPAVMVLEEALLGGGPISAPQPAKLWLGWLGVNETLFTTAEEALGPGAALPPVTEGEVVFDQRRNEVLLVGRQVGEAQLHLWALPLNPGAWQERGVIAGSTGVTGFRLVHDAVRGQTYLVGGERLSSDSPWPLVQALDSRTGQLTRVAGTGASAPLGRTNPGVFLDPTRRRLLVYGGERGGMALAELLSVDTISFEWSIRSANRVPDSPTPACYQ